MCVCIIKVFYTVLHGAYILGQMLPNVQYFASARAAAHKIYSIIDQVSKPVEHIVGCSCSIDHIYTMCDSKLQQTENLSV